MLRSLLMCLLLLIAPASAFAQRPVNKKPAPQMADEHYGPDKRQVFDLWQARSDTPTPLVVFIHGGGFHGGDKSSIPPTLFALLDRKISLMAIHYRLSPGVAAPTHFLDCARAIQFARHHAKEWNIDPKRIGAIGGSAGAGTSLWIGFHDDLARPDDSDPVLRESTRLTCMAVLGAQSTYDPNVIREWIGDAAARHPAIEGFYGMKTSEFKTPEALEKFREMSPITYLTKDDPPVYAFYNEPRGPLPAGAKPGTGIHHITFGLKLKEAMDKLGVECTVRHSDEGANPGSETNAFFAKHLLAE
jgi:acetyl esterase